MLDAGTVAAEMVSSPANTLVKRVRALQTRKGRQHVGAFFVEGIRPVWEAVEHGARLDTLIVAPELLRSEPAQRMVDMQRSAGVPVASVATAVFERITEREHPSGLAAIAVMPRTTLEDLHVTQESLFVAVHEPGNPGNLGTILRTIDAIDGSGLIAIGTGTDPYHPTAVKASMGALFSVPHVEVRLLDNVLAWSNRRQLHLVTTSDRASQPHWSVRYPRPCLILFGSEGQGLTDDTIRQGQLAVRIPMAGSADSLNLAVAAGILLYEVRRQDWEHSR